MSPYRVLVLLAAVVLGLCACRRDPSPPQPAAVAATLAPAAPAALPGDTSATHLSELDRTTFNGVAAELDLPLFWRGDANANGSVDPSEIAILWRAGPVAATDWLAADGFGSQFMPAYQSMVQVARHGHRLEGLAPAERKRRELVLEELRQGRPTLIESDLRAVSAQERVVVAHVLAAASGIERLFARQNGVQGMDDLIARDDAPSHALLRRNQVPWCEAPTTEKAPLCNALASRPSRASGLYPLDMQQNAAFCADLAKAEEHKALLAPFAAVVRGDGGQWTAVPYQILWPAEMAFVAKELQAAADALQDPAEAAFKAYLVAAAKAFVDGNWALADEAWARMGSAGSRWYLRIAPDETYFEPCSRKAGFHVSFARINQGSTRWHDLLEPHKMELETAMAKLAGPPYKARKVTFHLPDFIDVVVNAGDSRSALGATIGQSLPNYGPVASEGRGRTVAMVNLYTDADSKRTRRGQIESLLCPETMPWVSTEPEPQLMSTVLHEAAHNLGPSNEYSVGGKTDEEIFGGPLAATLEELKAQTAALYFADWLAERGLIAGKDAQIAHVADIAWDFGHVAQGMTTLEGKPKPYSQLAAIQLGALIEAGAVTWSRQAIAANGKDVGCFVVHAEAVPGAIATLMQRVTGAKARGDVKAGQALVQAYVERDDAWKSLRDVIRARWLRVPKVSFVYSVRL